jgi:MFS family permease
MQNVLGYTALEAGVRFLPTTLVIMVLSPLAGRLSDRIGPRWPIVGGMGMIALSLYLFSTVEVGTSFSGLLPSFLILGAGIGMTMSPMSTAAMNSVVTAKAGVASGILSMFRMIGGTFGVALLGALFQNQARSRLDETLAQSALSPDQRGELARGLAGGVPDVQGVPAAQLERLTAAAQDAFVYGLTHAMVLSVAVAAIGVVVAFVMIRGQGHSVDEEARASAEAAQAV